MAELNFTDPPGTEATIIIDDNKDRDFVRFFNAGTEVYRINKTGQRISTAGQKYRYIGLCMGDIAADSDSLTYPVMRLPHKAEILEVWCGVDTTVAANATNYVTIALKDVDANTICSITTASTGFTAGTARSMGTVSSTYGIVDANENVYMTFTKAASGVALSGFVLMIAYEIEAAFTNANTSSDTLPPPIQFVNSPDATNVITSDRAAGDHIIFKNDGSSVLNVNVDGKIASAAVDKHFIVSQYIGGITASGPTPSVFCLLDPSAKVKINAIWIGVNTTDAADSDSNYLTWTFTGGNSSGTICAPTTGGPIASGQALTAGTLHKVADENDDDLNEQNAVLASTDTLKLTLTKTGTGGSNLVGACVQIKFEKLE